MATSNNFSTDMGTLGSVMTPQSAPTAPSAVTSASSFFQSIAPSQQQIAIMEGKKGAAAQEQQKYDTGAVVSSYEEKLSRIADAVQLGKSPAWAGQQRRALYNQYAAQFPQFSDKLVESNNAYMSDLGKVANTGNEQYQQQQANEKLVNSKAAELGMSVPQYLQFQADQTAWKYKDQANQEAQAVLSMQATRQGITAQAQSMYIQKQNFLKEQRVQDTNDALAANIAHAAASAQGLLTNLANATDLPPEQRAAQIRQAAVGIKANLASTYGNASSDAKNTALSLVDTMTTNAIDIATGKDTAAASDNSLKIMQNKAIQTAYQSKPELLAAHAIVSAMGPNVASMLNGVVAKQVDAAGDLMTTLTSALKTPTTNTQPLQQNTPTSASIPPPMQSDEHFSWSKTFSQAIPQLDEKAAGTTKPEVLGSMISGELKSFNLYGGNGHYDQPTVDKFVQHLYTDQYNSLKQVGSVKVDPQVMAKSKDVMDAAFEPVYKQIQELYRKGTTLAAPVTSTGDGGVAAGSATNVAVPYVDANGIFSFKVADGMEGNPKALQFVDQLNKQTKPAINNLAKVYAVLSGDPDLVKAQRMLTPYLFGAKDASSN